MKSPFFLKSKTGLLRFAISVSVLCLGLCWVSTISSEQESLKAPRTDAPDSSCSSCGVVACPASGDLDSVRACICEINQDLDDIESKIDELFIDFKETWTAIDECCEHLSSLIDELHTEVTESFNETWTVIDGCCEHLTSIIEEMHTEMNESFNSTWTKIDECCGEGTVMCCDELPDCDAINASEAGIISWLKTLYAMNRGFIQCDDGPVPCPCDEFAI